MPCYNDTSLYYRYSDLFIGHQMDKIKKTITLHFNNSKFAFREEREEGHKHITNYMRRAKEHREAIANIYKPRTIRQNHRTQHFPRIMLARCKTTAKTYDKQPKTYYKLS